MTRVSFNYPDGTSNVIEVEDGTSLMRAAVVNGVAGIVGECGGQAMCATCHVLVRDPFVDVLPAMSEDEDEMLDCTADPRDATRSRLGCQIVAGPELADLEVDVPASQV